MKRSLFSSLGEEWACFDGDGAPIPLDGWLTIGNDIIEVQVRYASKDSMYIDLDPNLKSMGIDNLKLRIDNEIVEIGPCKISRDTIIGWGIARCHIAKLIPFKTNYNFKQLFFTGNPSSKIQNKPFPSI